jgi:hypothetical protein
VCLIVMYIEKFRADVGGFQCDFFCLVVPSWTRVGS